MTETERKEAFKDWLQSEGPLGTPITPQSAVNYSGSVEAVSKPMGGHPNTGAWNGIFEYLVGVPPEIKIFECESLDQFDAVYGEFYLLFGSDDRQYGSFDHSRYDECFDYTHSSNSGDHQRMKNAVRAYRRFLADSEGSSEQVIHEEMPMMSNVLSAIRTKPFLLLAGISGTGKSRLVRQLARGFCPAKGPLGHEQKPGNFEMIQVRPNWHDSTELLGYVSRVSGTPEFVVKDFVKFLVKAWMYPNVPFFLCLDEMNLAPVEQYFAEYLSIIESRQLVDGRIVTDPILTFEDAVYDTAKEKLLRPYAGEEFQAAREALSHALDADHGLRIPPNLVVMGTVNMDETTFSFSRKVLDRAMSFELNEVKMRDGLEQSTKVALGAFGHDGSPLQTYVEADEVYPPNKELCDKILDYLEQVNAVLDKTPFKIAYRSRNEIMIYCVERTKNDVVKLPQALDEATSMKILSRIEGDRRRLHVDNTRTLLDVLKETIDAQLKALNDNAEPPTHICREKLDEMKVQLEGGYTSFWTR